MSIAEARKQPAPSDIVATVQAITQRLERAWNSADGTAFGEVFSPDADFVPIGGDLHAGRDAVPAGHQQVLGTIYVGSTIRYQVLRARELGDGVILAHVRAALSVPGGPLAGEHTSTITAVLLERDHGWEV